MPIYWAYLRILGHPYVSTGVSEYRWGTLRAFWDLWEPLGILGNLGRCILKDIQRAPGVPSDPKFLPIILENPQRLPVFLKDHKGSPRISWIATDSQGLSRVPKQPKEFQGHSRISRFPSIHKGFQEFSRTFSIRPGSSRVLGYLEKISKYSQWSSSILEDLQGSPKNLKDPKMFSRTSNDSQR